MNLEEKMLSEIKDGKKVDLEEALLIASGADTEEKVAEYKKKLGWIHNGLARNRKRKFGSKTVTDMQKAELIFDYLYETKPKRYCKNFRLTEVIDAQLFAEKDKPVGNCVGLTSLYTLLAKREGLLADIIYFSNYVGDNNHVATKVHTPEGDVTVENTTKNGFDYNEVYNSYRKSQDLPAEKMLALLYESRGCEATNKGEVFLAISLLNKAILLQENYASAYANRAWAFKMGRNFSQADSDIEKALSLEPENKRFLVTKSALLTEKGKYADAIVLCDDIIKQHPTCASAYFNRGAARLAFGGPISAKSDFTAALKYDSTLAPLYAKCYESKLGKIDLETTEEQTG